RHAYFVGSYHLPNFDGFVRMAGPDLGYLPPDAETCVVGDVCHLLRDPEVGGFGPFPGANASRLQLLGAVSDEDKAALLDLVNVILLPVTCGGGSNLKTVEALLARKPIVATRYAFRSYEEFQDLPHVQLADEPDEFKRSIVRCLTRCRDEVQIPSDPEWEDRLGQITWKKLGESFV